MDSHQFNESYKARIQRLEDVVHFLLARTKPAWSSLVPTAPPVGSFRYSIDRGLKPLVSEGTALFLKLSSRNLVPTSSSSDRSPVWLQPSSPSSSSQRPQQPPPCAHPRSPACPPSLPRSTQSIRLGPLTIPSLVQRLARAAQSPNPSLLPKSKKLPFSSSVLPAPLATTQHPHGSPLLPMTDQRQMSVSAGPTKDILQVADPRTPSSTPSSSYISPKHSLSRFSRCSVPSISSTPH